MTDGPRRERREDEAAEQAARLQRVKARETEAARRLVEQFVEQALDRGVRPVALRARSLDGRSRYRTDLHGWYLKRDRSIAVDTAGRFYVMSAPASLRARISGVTLSPDDPPMVVGAGGRDGDSMDLPALLELRLDAGDDWPE